jgi:recombination protein RecA
MYGTGISLSGDILDMAAELGIIEKAGSWYSYNGERIGQGRENVKAYLEENPKVMEEVRAKLMAQMSADGNTSDDKEIKVDEDGVVIE